jgi:hypothetical protein
VLRCPAGDLGTVGHARLIIPAKKLITRAALRSFGNTGARQERGRKPADRLGNCERFCRL